MAVGSAAAVSVSHLLRIQICCAQAQQAAIFYESTLGFHRIAVEHLSGSRTQESFGIGGRALRITLALGMQRITLVQFVDRPGKPYPVNGGSSDLIFQHFALVVSDMASAMTRLQQTADWTPITRDGPQVLPGSSGGVTAFKFRDPEGHPLELLAFPANGIPKHWQQVEASQVSGPFLGIDHSAISVSDSQGCIAFYEAMGLSVSNRSVNEGPAQARLDDLDQPVVEVTAMAVAGNATPHLELLGYLQRGERPVLDLRANDIATTCLIFGDPDGPVALNAHALPMRRMQDPDGHHLAIVSRRPGG